MTIRTALVLAAVSVPVAASAQTEIIFTHNEPGTWRGAADVGQVFLFYDPPATAEPFGQWVDFDIVPVSSTARNDDYVFATGGIDWSTEAPPAIRVCVDMSARGFRLLCGPWWSAATVPPAGAPSGIAIASSPTGETLRAVTRPTP